jgi:hypothetical protein
MFKKARKGKSKYFENDLFQDKRVKWMLKSHKNFGTTCRIQLKENIKHPLKKFIDREDIELLCYIIYTRSNLNGARKSRFNEDQIKCKIR